MKTVAIRHGINRFSTGGRTRGGNVILWSVTVVLCYLLPWFYWQQQADKTRHPELKQRYLQAESHSHLLILEHPITQQMHEAQLQH